MNLWIVPLRIAPMTMESAALPAFLRSRFQEWHTRHYAARSGFYRRIACERQTPRAMVLSCCDSRVVPQAIFSAEPGELFTLRNVASLVPPCEADGAHHGVSAALEFAVMELSVPHIVVMGHSRCGGVAAFYERKCRAGASPEDGRSGPGFIERWMTILEPAWDRLSAALPEGEESRDAALRALEQLGVEISIENLLTFPFVRAALARGTLSLHGAWFDIGAGRLRFLEKGMWTE